jgi:hypothetical protein
MYYWVTEDEDKKSGAIRLILLGYHPSNNKP